MRARPIISFMIQGPVVLAMPALISGWPMVTPGWPMRMSPSSATWNPDPAATPFSAMISGFERPRIDAVEPLPFVDPLFGAVGVEGLGLVQVLPGAEGALAGAGQDDRAHVGLALRGLERVASA